ncbi:MAG: hypothetical protein ABJB49_08330, partial [Nitrospirota bacterium]
RKAGDRAVIVSPERAGSDVITVVRHDHARFTERWWDGHEKIFRGHHLAFMLVMREYSIARFSSARSTQTNNENKEYTANENTI